MNDKEIDDLISKCQNHNLTDDEIPDKLDALRSIPQGNQRYEDAQDCIEELEKKLSQLPPPPTIINEKIDENDDEEGKKKTKPIWFFILLATILVLGIGVVIYTAIRNDDSVNNSSKEYSATSSNQTVESSSESETTTSKNEVIESKNEISSSAETEKNESMVEMIDCTNMLADQAKGKITNSGLKFELKEEYSSAVNAGYVISQSIKEGEFVKKGSTVHLVISKGKKPSETTITTKAPETTTKAPETTTKVPETTTKAPETTTKVPETTTKVPETTTTTTTTKAPVTEAPAVVMTVYFDFDGGTNDQSSKLVTQGKIYGELPTTSTKTGYTFSGWTDVNGNSVTASTKVTETSTHTLYAKWTPKTFTVSFDINGGNTSHSSISVTYNSTYGTLPTPTRDYYTFDGWFTTKSGGSQVTSTTKVALTSNQTLYAHWTEKPLSNWVLASDAPLYGVKYVNQKWTYTKTETTTSTASSMSGWTQTGSSWSKTGGGTAYYSTEFPSGFSTSHSIYTSMSKSQPYTSYTYTDTKREVSTAWAGYVYWKWGYAIADKSCSSKRAINNVKTGSYNLFRAFTSTKGDYSNDKYYCNSKSITNYIITDQHTSYEDCAGCYRWFRFNYYSCTYTDYQKIYSYKKVTENLESTTQVYASDTISNVQYWVRYREK